MQLVVENAIEGQQQPVLAGGNNLTKPEPDAFLVLNERYIGDGRTVAGSIFKRRHRDL